MRQHNGTEAQSDIRQTMLVYVKSNLRPRACHSSGRPSRGVRLGCCGRPCADSWHSLDSWSGSAWLVGGGASPPSSSKSRIRGTVDVDDMACVEGSRATPWANACESELGRFLNATLALQGAVCVTQGRHKGNGQRTAKRPLANTI